MGIKINVNINTNQINKRIERAHRAATNQMALECDRFVPMRNGTLRRSSTVSPDGKSVIWRAPYAHYQYMGVSKLGKTNWTYTTPGTGPKWNKKVAGDSQSMKNIVDIFRKEF